MSSSPPLVLALNPAMDVEWRVERVLPEEKNDVLDEHRWPGGKGINVARWLHLLASPSVLLAVVAGPTGSALVRGCRAWGLRVRPFRLPGDSRSNIIVTSGQGGQWRFNHRGPLARPADFRRLRTEVARLASPGRWVVFSGSRTPGLPDDAYRHLIDTVHRRGGRTVLDCEGPALAAAVRSRPYLVKPNEHELATWAGRELPGPEDLATAARSLSRATGGWVLLSRGSEGAWLLHEGRRQGWTARASSPRPRPVRNTVGAGDAALAGALAAMQSGRPPEDWLRGAVGAGSACVGEAAGRLPSVARLRSSLRQVSLEPLAPGPA